MLASLLPEKVTSEPEAVIVTVPVFLIAAPRCAADVLFVKFVSVIFTVPDLNTTATLQLLFVKFELVMFKVPALSITLPLLLFVKFELVMFKVPPLLIAVPLKPFQLETLFIFRVCPVARLNPP